MDQRRLWTVVAALGALLVAIAAWMIADARQPAPAETVGRARSTSPSAKTAAPTSPMPATVLPPPVAAAESPAAIAQRTGTGVRTELAVCGTTQKALVDDARDADDPARALAKVLPPPWEAMQGSADERVRAAGLAFDDRLGPLVQLATATRDPAVLRVARDACDRSSGAAAASCALLTARRQAELEPDNAAAWLEVALESQQHNDASAADEALRRAAQASRFERHELAASAAVERHAAAVRGRGSDPSAWLVVAVARESAAMSSGSVGSLCGAGEVARSARREVCEKVQALLDLRGTSVRDRADARAIGGVLGTVDEARAERERRLDAAVMARARRDAQPAGVGANKASPYECDALRAQQRWVYEMGERGEWSVMHTAAMAAFDSDDALVRWHEEEQARSRTPNRTPRTPRP